MLTGGEAIQIWEFVVNTPFVPSVPQKVQFHLGAAAIGEDDDPATQRLVQAIADPDYLIDHHSESDPGQWECVWKVK